MEYKRLNFEDYFIICSNNWNKRKTALKTARYDAITYEDNGETYQANYQVRFDESRNCIQIILQKSSGKMDWKANFNFASKIYDKFTFEGKSIQLMVHRGWGNMWLACQQAIRAKVSSLLEEHPSCFIEIFGWSLGSALAQLAAEDVYFKFGIKPYLYTYGSVRPFYGKDTYNFVKSCCVEAYNFYDHCDIVGYAVPFLGWNAINHCKVELDKFSLSNLFKPQIYHTQYDVPELYTKYN